MIEEIFAAMAEPLTHEYTWFGVALYAGFRKEMRTLVTSLLKRISERVGSNGSEETK